MDTIHLLMRFGLTHQEANIYIQLHGREEATGYELAKAGGISRANAYACLANLVDKGAAWLIEGRPIRYRAAPVEEFCGGVIRELTAARDLLAERIRAPREDSDSYLTIRGEGNIRNKIQTLIADTQSHIYLSMGRESLEGFLPALEDLIARGRKVVVITGDPPGLPGATIHCTQSPSEAIRVISDTAAALTGNLAGGPDASCLYSRKPNLVSLLRDSMRNEILLIQRKEQRGDGGI